MTGTAVKIEIMQAFEDGRDVEVRSRSMVKWRILNRRYDPDWDWSENEYRILVTLETTASQYAKDVVEDRWPVMVVLNSTDDVLEILEEAYMAGYKEGMR